MNLETLPFSEFTALIEKTPFDDLIMIKEKYDDIYHNTGENGISDARYDFIVETLSKHEKFRPGVGAKLREGENRAVHSQSRNHDHGQRSCVHPRQGHAGSRTRQEIFRPRER